MAKQQPKPQAAQTPSSVPAKDTSLGMLSIGELAVEGIRAYDLRQMLARKSAEGYLLADDLREAEARIAGVVDEIERRVMGRKA